LAILAAVATACGFMSDHALVNFAASIGMVYLAIYSIIKLGEGMANSIMLLGYEKTLTENMKSTDPKSGDRAAMCLGLSYGLIAVMIVLVTMVLNSFLVTYAAAAAMFLGLGMLWLLGMGYQAKRWRDRFGK
jgi:hypothetical protein